MIKDRNVDPNGITAKRLAMVVAAFLGTPTVPVSAASAADIHTSQAKASYTAAAGTQPSAARNLYYEMSVSSTVAWASCSGTISVAGLDPWGRAVTESVAISALMASGTDGYAGKVLFGSINSNGITKGAVTLSSEAHAQSNNVSWYIGGGAWLPVPNYVSNSAAIVRARVGTSPVAFTTSALFSTSKYSTGAQRYAAVNLSGGTYATNKPVMLWYQANGKPITHGQRG